MLRLRSVLVVRFVILRMWVVCYFRIQHCKRRPREIHSVPEANEF